MVLCVVFGCSSRSNWDLTLSNTISYYKWVFPRRKIDNKETRIVDTSDKSRRRDMRIKVKIDRHGLPMWLSRPRRVTAFKLHFCSQEHVLKRFSLFVKDDRRFCKICFQQRLIVYQTPLFHQYLFDIFNCRVARCDERQYTFVTFRPLCILMADCLEASWPLTETFLWCFLSTSCFEALFEFQTALFKCFFFYWKS